MTTLKFCPGCATSLVQRELGGRQRPVCPVPECEYVFWGNPVPVVAAVVEYQQQILLARNVEWPPGFFGLIAGYLEAKEAPEDAILRELQEEVGLAGRVIAPIGQYPYFEKNQLILAYHVEASGQIVVGPELAEIKLVPMDKLRPWAFGTGLAVRDWLTRRSNAGP